MQTGAVSVLLLAVAATTIGCVDRDPYSAGDVAAADAFHARQAALALRHEASGSTAAGKVRCRCDADGALHVQAPSGAKVVTVNEGTSEDAEAEITLPERRPGTPIRQTVSLGFIGDNKLNETPTHSRGDALLPPHAHVDHSYGYGGYGGYRGYGGYGYGGVSRSSGGHVQHASGGTMQSSGGRNVSSSPPVHYSSGSSYGGGNTGNSGPVSSGRGPR